MRFCWFYFIMMVSMGNCVNQRLSLSHSTWRLGVNNSIIIHFLFYAEKWRGKLARGVKEAVKCFELMEHFSKGLKKKIIMNKPKIKLIKVAAPFQ